MEIDEYAQYAARDDRAQRAWYATVSFWTLVAANAVVIILAMREELEVSTVIWGYWCQNIVLGLFWPAKVFASSVDSSYKAKVRSVCAFIPHYMIIHFCYAMFLHNFFLAYVTANLGQIVIMAGVFFLSETVSYFVDTARGHSRSLSMAAVQLFPYARVLPMHIVVAIGVFAVVAGEYAHLGVLLVLCLKAAADLAMHIVEQRTVFRSGATHPGKERSVTGQSAGAPGEPKAPRIVCSFCQRRLARDETPRTIKSRPLCQACFEKINAAMKATDERA